MEYLKVWTSFRELLEPLNESERGRLFMAMLEYAETGKVPELKGNERYVWPAAKQSIDNTRDKSEQMRSNRIKSDQTETNPNKSKQTASNRIKSDQTETNPNNPFDKEKEKENIYTTTTARAREETSFGPVDLDPLVLKLQQDLNGMTDNHYAAFNDYRAQLGDELVSHAVDEAVGNGVRNWNYVEAIMRGYVKDGVKTVGEAKARDERRKTTVSHQKPKILRAQDYEQRDWKEAEMAEKLGVDDLFKESAS